MSFTENFLKSVNAEMPIPRPIARMAEVVTRSQWMKTDQEWEAPMLQMLVKMYAELTGNKNGKKQGIKSLCGNRFGFDDDGTVFLREASSDAYSARYGGYYQNYIPMPFHGYWDGLAT